MSAPGAHSTRDAGPGRWPVWALLVAAALVGQTALAWVAVAGLAALVLARGRLVWWPACTVVVVAALLNSLKWPESDLADYYRYLDEAAQVGLWDLLSEEQAFLSIRITEPLFRAWMWLVANASPAPRVLFAWLGGLFTYACALALCRLSARSDANAPADLSATAWATAASLMIGVTLSLTGHLVRQYLAGGLFFVGLFGFAYRGGARWLLLCAAACAVHNAVLLLAGPLVVALLLQRRPGTLAVVLVAVVAASLGGFIPLLGDLAEATSFLKDDGEIGIVLPLLDLTVLAAATLVWRHSAPQTRPAVRGTMLLLAFGLLFAVALFCLREIPLLFFRSYFFLEFLRVPLLAFIITAVLRRAGTAAPAAALFTLVLAAALCWLRVQGTDWEYGHPAARWPEALDLHSVLVRWAAIENLPL